MGEHFEAALGRRAFLAGVAGVVAAACSDGGDDPPEAADATTTTEAASTTPSTTTTTTVPVPELPGDPFTLGVASGDPLPGAVIIWTRLAPDPMGDGGGMPADDVPVTWQVAADETFADVVAEGTFTAVADHGHAVHVDVTDLEPATTYHYRFSVGDHTSPLGRTRTAPADGTPVESLRFAVANCSAWKSGYFTPYTHLAEEPELDAVFFVGDYIYELESGTLRDHGLPIPYSLDEYRAFYAVTRLEAECAAAHAAHPWIMMWDDHEVEDNYAGLLPGGIGSALVEDPVAAFPARRAAAYQAWWEHMPVRADPPVDGDLRIYRDFAFGDLAHVAVIDNRQYRSPILEGEGAGNLPRPLGGGPQLEGTFDESRTILGEEQEAWLEDSLRHDKTWTVLVQQTLMSEVDRAPGDPTKGFSMDSWDGYVAARERLLRFVEQEGVPNLVVLGGDIHTSAVSDLKVSYREPDSPVIGSEFVAPSVTALELLLPEFVEGSRSNPHIKLYETQRRGYLVVAVTPEEVRADYRWVATTQEPTSDIETGSSWRVAVGTPGAQPV